MMHSHALLHGEVRGQGQIKSRSEGHFRKGRETRTDSSPRCVSLFLLGCDGMSHCLAKVTVTAEPSTASPVPPQKKSLCRHGRVSRL